MVLTDETHTCTIAGAAYRAHQRNHTTSTKYDPHCHITRHMDDAYSLEALQAIVGEKLGRPCPLAALGFLSLAEGDESVRELARGMHVSRYCVSQHERDIRFTLIPMLRVAARQQAAPHEAHYRD